MGIHNHLPYIAILRVSAQPKLLLSGTYSAADSWAEISNFSVCLVQNEPFTSSRGQLLLLPVFYAPLDATELPVIFAQLDSSANVEHTSTSILCILLSLRGIGVILQAGAVPNSAYPDIWPRLWPFIQFLDTYRDHLPEPNHVADEPTYTMFMTLFRCMGDHEPTAAVVSAMRGMRVIIGRAWHFLFDTPVERGLLEFLTILLRTSWTVPAHFEELVAGSGSRKDLTSLAATNYILIFCGGRAAVAGGYQMFDNHHKGLGRLLHATHREVDEEVPSRGSSSSYPLLHPQSGSRSERHPGSPSPHLKPPSRVNHLLLDSLAKVRGRDAADTFVNPEIRDHWRSLLKLARERLAFQLHQNSEQGSVQAMCWVFDFGPGENAATAAALPRIAAALTRQSQFLTKGYPKVKLATCRDGGCAIDALVPRGLQLVPKALLSLEILLFPLLHPAYPPELSNPNMPEVWIKLLADSAVLWRYKSYKVTMWRCLPSAPAVRVALVVADSVGDGAGEKLR
ncbi:hypothetical protein B0H16DRAFT_1473016 [Mycena metata]|uniref:Uncharacterized protein n=1 Tax=Mycena metata TaxID=1033252 RepID=A0AAD7HL69_9AGAR|nr:hypothetical protein B0H16DRAFT_1473016 [Mycena metata]